MQIDTKISTDVVTRAMLAVPTAKRTDTAADSAKFENVDALNRNLASEQESRAEEVEKAMNLIGHVQYPPPVVIRRIANLLATNIYQPTE